MNLRLKSFLAFVLIFGLVTMVSAQPVFENRTPVGFSPSDSTSTSVFVTDTDITVLVDLNEAANSSFPVVGSFQKVEKAVPYFSSASTAGYMSQAVAVDANGVIHRAWIQARGNAVIGNGTIASTNTTPAYGVVYAKSFNGGRTFTDTVSVSGSLRFDLITPNLSMTSGFSTMDLTLDSKGNPRVVYALDQSPDGLTGLSTHQRTAYTYNAAQGFNKRAYNNIYFNYSNDGGSTWLPANNAVVVNDTATVIGRKNAFPRMAITSTDDIFIVYQRDIGTGAVSDIVLAKMDADSLKSGAAQPVRVGPMGTTTSAGGVRLDIEANHDVSPDIAIGDDDVLHVVWYNVTNETIYHKTLPAANWTDVSAQGWSNAAAGASVGTFDLTAGTNLGLDIGGTATLVDEDYIATATVPTRLHLFPTVVVDRQRTPDRVYTLWKHTDATAATIGADENVAYNTFSYNGAVGARASWGTTQYAFPQGSGSALYNTGGSGMFQHGTMFQIEGFWGYVDRIAAFVDDRVPGSRGDLHIVFSGGPSQRGPRPLTGSLSGQDPGKAVSMYYARFDGTEWELPQVVASARNTETGNATSHDDGVLAKSRQLYEPDIAMRSGDDNVYLTFVGGSPRVTATQIGARPMRITTSQSTNNPGRGFATIHQGNVAPLPYFKILGRVVTFDDVSSPPGAFKYELTYNPVNPQAAARKNLIYVSVGDNANGSGQGGATPGSSAAPGGFLTGQWRRLGLGSLGVTSLNVGGSGAVFKGAVSAAEASNDNGVFEGRADDSGNSDFAEWGDDADKVGLMVKLNVLGSDSGTNLFVIKTSTAAKFGGATGTNSLDSASQSITIDTTSSANSILGPAPATFVTGITVVAAMGGVTDRTPGVGFQAAPMGSYFWMGANINIVAANSAPVVQVVDPDGSTIASGAFANETVSIRYVLFDADTNPLTSTTGLQMELYAYPDRGLRNVQDIRTFATLIADEQDIASVNSNGTGDFTEGTSSTNVQSYTWDDPGAALRGLGFAALTKMLDGNWYIYIVADDLVNPPVFDVSDGALKVRHIPLVKSLAPVANDTVDTGEFSNLSKTNPYKINFKIVDYDDNAQVRLFFSTNASIPRDSVTVSGTFPNLTLKLGGTQPMQLSDSLRSEDDINFTFDVTAQGSARDSVLVQGNYTIYAVVSDGDSTVLGISGKPLAVRHSPSFEFTAPLVGTVNNVNTSQQERYSIEWQRGRSDRDLDGNAIISLYYIGIDPNRKNFSGTDSTALIDSGATLITGSIREDAEGKADQYVWNFRNPPGVLPKTFRPKPTTTGQGSTNPHSYQVGRTTDTAWVYAVLHDSLGNTRVQAGGSVLLLGSQASPGSPAPKVTVRTPPSGGMTIVNGDVVRLEWDAFMIDDGTGTDDAYLRLYAAPKGLYSTLTQLEGNNLANGGQVILINSLKGRDDVASQITTLRESGSAFYNWDTKTTSFKISGTPIEYDIFVAGSIDPYFGDNVLVNGKVDSIASGIGSQAQRAVLSKSPGALKVIGTDPLFSVELSPGAMTAASGDTLSMDVLVNSQGSSVNLMDFHLDVPRRYFEVVDMDANTAGMQPFKDSTGAFQAPSTIIQNDTTQGTDTYLKLNFVETVILGETIGRMVSPYDSSQVAARLKLKVKRFTGGAPLDTFLVWSTQSGRKTALYQQSVAIASPARDGAVKLVPRARVSATVPLEGRANNYADTLDVHLRLIGSDDDITDTTYIAANDVKKVYLAGVLEDSVQVVSDAFGSFQLYEIPPGTYEMTVKAKGYVSGRSDTLRLFNGSSASITPTFGSDALGNLSPATPLAALRAGDATGDNQIDIADANLIFARWNLTPASASYSKEIDFNRDNVINSLDLVLVTTNFGNDGYGAPPVFKRTGTAGDNSTALVEVVGQEEVEQWWAGRTFEVKAVASGMQDVAGYGFTLSYDPEKVKPLGEGQAVAQGEIFKANRRGALFYQQVAPGLIDVTAGRVGREWSASGRAELATVRFVALGDDPGLIEIASGELVNSDYRAVSMRVKKAQPLPLAAALHQNYPNPFNPSTEIRFDLPTARDVKLTIYNQAGQAIRTLVDRRMKAGAYALKWDGTNNAGWGVASGVYFYSIEAGDFSQIRKMTLVK
ncbi:MAG: T9SS type A sorting domain-containing protein [Candidatus Handelsmanbacteria bacterium]|nr:T9SS type A sorting domain-containing protein [Candidatus Handelsmanbacteria bacterium]